MSYIYNLSGSSFYTNNIHGGYRWRNAMHLNLFLSVLQFKHQHWTTKRGNLSIIICCKNELHCCQPCNSRNTYDEEYPIHLIPDGFEPTYEATVRSIQAREASLSFNIIVGLPFSF